QVGEYVSAALFKSDLLMFHVSQVLSPLCTVARSNRHLVLGLQFLASTFSETRATRKASFPVGSPQPCEMHSVIPQRNLKNPAADAFERLCIRGHPAELKQL
ncbi:MAG: hypothetical protein ND866_19915, partial [Pyrinomonadaceae bacterium]|nr:hypothetical protein [Pyrinomonadaceae bacterium]